MTVTVDDTNLQAIADAIRAKNGSEGSYKPSEMAAAITAIETSPDLLSITISNTKAGTLNVRYVKLNSSGNTAFWEKAISQGANATLDVLKNSVITLFRDGTRVDPAYGEGVMDAYATFSTTGNTYFKLVYVVGSGTIVD